jgi:D-glycero-alpha-D-manno-heptose 1-phosphate guanylyltransferase
MECIILAGGLGTRLQNTIGNLQKCMADINGQPFLHYIFVYLQQQKCTHVVLSLGYKHDTILEWLNRNNFSFDLDFVVEETPLGTGGGIQLALKKCEKQNVVVLNGDTFFSINLDTILSFHIQQYSTITLALKEMKKFARYGSVFVNDEHQITAFEEKKFKEDGLINGGIYVVNREQFFMKKSPKKFSFEKDYLEHYVAEKSFFGKVFQDYFIDIGIPEDYQKAQTDFKTIFS